MGKSDSKKKHKCNADTCGKRDCKELHYHPDDCSCEICLEKEFLIELDN